MVKGYTIVIASQGLANCLSDYGSTVCSSPRGEWMSEGKETPRNKSCLFPLLLYSSQIILSLLNHEKLY